MGGTRASASNLPIFLWILGCVSQNVSHDGLPLGYPDGLPNGKQTGKKKPRQQGVLSGLWGGW